MNEQHLRDKLRLTMDYRFGKGCDRDTVISHVLDRLFEELPALAAPAAKGGTEVPAGWKLVPIEPTKAMKEAAFGPIMEGGRGGPITADRIRQEAALSTFAKIIAASPPPPTPAAKCGTEVLADMAQMTARDCDSVMQVMAALDDMSEGWLESAGEASASGEKNYERREMHIHNIMVGARNELLSVVKALGPSDYFPRKVSANPTLLTAARDEIRRLNTMLAASPPPPAPSQSHAAAQAGDGGGA